MRQLAAEITREKIYQKLHQELPYQSTVETDSWTERKDKSVRIEQTIFVERESQRKIVLGKGGATIKSIGADSRKEIAEILGVARASVPVRESARELGRRSRPLSRDGTGVPQRVSRKTKLESAMNLPRNVFRFEVLLYASLMLDALSVAVQDRTPTAEMTRPDDHGHDRARRRHDPAAALFRPARRARAQELAALGAGGRAGAVGASRCFR